MASSEDRGIGIVVGVIDASGRRMAGYGSQSRGGARSLVRMDMALGQMKGPGGMDIYEAKFEHGSAGYRIMLSSDGKIDGAPFRLTP